MYSNNAEMIVFRTRMAAAILTLLLGSLVFAVAKEMFGSVAAFYRYVKKPTAGRLVLTGLGAGLGLATKHSAILIPPMQLVLALCEVLRREAESADVGEGRSKRGLRLLGAIAVVGIIAFAVLWSCYGFHFHPKAGGMPAYGWLTMPEG